MVLRALRFKGIGLVLRARLRCIVVSFLVVALQAASSHISPAFAAPSIAGHSDSTEHLSRDEQKKRYRFKALTGDILDMVGGQWSIAEDAQGFLWFGGANGLARYDGYEFKLFRHLPESPTSLSDSGVNDILVDSRGNIWVATYNGLNLYNALTESFSRFTHNPREFTLEEKPEPENYQIVTVPGRVEAELVSDYFDTTNYNQGSTSCSNLFLDVQITEDGDGGCNIGWTEPGEWTEYIIRVMNGGKYNVTYRAGTALPNKYFSVEVNEKKMEGTVQVPEESWSTFSDIRSTLNLDSGENVIRIHFDTGGVNLNYFDIMKASSDELPGSENDIAPANPSVKTLGSNTANTKIDRVTEKNITSKSIKDSSAVVVDTPQGGGGDNHSSMADAVSYPIEVPAKIEAEFPQAYLDMNPDNQSGPGEFQFGSLDIAELPGGEPGCCVSYSEPGEWLEYSVISKKNNKYRLNLRATTGIPNAVLKIFVDDKEVANSITIKQGNWVVFYDHHVEIPLSEGVNKLRLEFVSGGINLDFLDIQPLSEVDESQGSTDKIAFKQSGIDHFTALNSLSHQSILTLMEAKSGEIYIGTGGGLNIYNPVDGVFQIYLPRDNDDTSLSGYQITALYEDTSNRVWIGTKENGLNYFDQKTAMFKRFEHQDNNSHSLSNNRVTVIFEDSANNLWVGTEGGLNLLNVDTGEFRRYLSDVEDASSISSNYITDILEDSEGNLWVSTDGKGLNKYINGSFERFQAKGRFGVGLLNNKTRSLFEDSSGGLWVGHYPAGVSYVDRYASAFRVFRHNENSGNSLSNSDILSLEEGFSGKLWVGTEDGLNLLDIQTETVTRYLHNPLDPHSLPADPVTAIEMTADGELWVGTWQGGLARLVKGGNTFKRYPKLKNKVVWYLYQDQSLALWIGTDKNLQVLRPGSEDFTVYAHSYHEASTISSGGIHAILKDSQGNFWVGGDDGLNLMHRDVGKFTTFHHVPGKTNALSAKIIHGVFEDSSKRIWVSTRGGGVSQFNSRTYEFSSIRAKDGLADDVVGCMLEDRDGLFWIGTGRGLSRYNPQNGEFKTYTEDYGLAGNLHKGKGCIKLRNGDLAFGSTNGLTIFSPDKLFENTIESTLVLTDLKIFNQSVVVGEEGAPLSTAISQTKRLKLTHNQAMFSIDFALLNYTMPERNQYAYKLEGFDQGWNYIGNRRTATYTNLDAGEYTLRIKGANNEEVWSNKSVSLAITILPPWWLTWWAYALYALSFALLLGVGVYVRWQQRRAEYEKQVNERLLQVDKMKDSFLANTSHELRTPLNGIIGLSESLIDGATGELSGSTKENLKMIVNSGRRLSCLINDILDFSKLRDHTITLHRQNIDLYSLTEFVMTLSKSLLNNKNVRLQNEVDKHFPAVRADENRLQQILYNLVGNAIKFTHKGSVTVKTKVESGQVWVEVVDTGIGISQEKIEHVFEAFSQIDENDTRKYGGTGLGLAVTKQLVALHGGEINVDSTLGQGTTFRFSLSMSNRPIVGQEGAEAPATYTVPNSENSLPNYENIDLDLDMNQAELSQFHILVVDDEMINRQVLKNHLSMQAYRISVCCSGEEALTRLNGKNDIDLVLLDIMMPQMSGYEVCAKLRVDYEAHELPIIFLTAKNQVSDLEAGYAVGANDFLAKPITKEELLARVDTHLQLLVVSRDLEAKVVERTEELREINRALKSTQSQLVQSEKMSSLGVLVAGIGHEINNPASFASVAASNLELDLERFRLFIDELFSDDIDPQIVKAFEEWFEGLNQHLNSMLTGTDRVVDIVNNLRTFSKLDNVEMDFSRLKDGLESTLRLVKANYKNTLEFECLVVDDPEIECIPSEINQVFMNLMVNACQSIAKFKEEEDESFHGRLCISMERIGSELIIEFNDNGPGMSEDVIEHIFEPFYTTKGDSGGTGLGLSVSYGIIDRHSGRIDVKSSPGEGACMRVILPIGKASLENGS